MEQTDNSQFKYFKVVARGGHKGIGQSGELVFYVKARSAYHAMQKTRFLPAVKHHKQTPFNVEEIDYETYKEGRKKNTYDNYFNIKKDNHQR